MDSLGAPVAYHVLRQHPGDRRRVGLEWDRVPAYGSRTQRRNALHLYAQLRPAQTRGVPYLAAVIEPLKQLERYTDAEIMAAVVAGMFTVFVKSEGDGLSPLDSAVGPNTGTERRPPAGTASSAMAWSSTWRPGSQSKPRTRAALTPTSIRSYRRSSSRSASRSSCRSKC